MNFRVKFNEENSNFRVKFGEVQVVYVGGEETAAIIKGLIAKIEVLERLLEALENGGGSNNESTTAILGTAILGQMVLGGSSSTISVLGTATLGNLRLA